MRGTYGYVAGTHAGTEPCTSEAQELATWPLTWAALYGAGDGNRTRMTSLEGWSSAIELHPQGSGRVLRLPGLERS